MTKQKAGRLGAMIVGQETNRFSFPANDAELNDDLIDQFGLREPLQKFGEALIKQYAESEVVGVKISGISFSFILQRREP